MGAMEDYIQMMIDSLKKKSTILDRIIAKNEVQCGCVKEKQFDEIDWDTFNIAIAEKEAEIERINEMDGGFQALYDRVSVQLKEHKDKYASKIKQMQLLIAEIEEKSIVIRTGEERNRALIEKVLTGRKNEIRQVRKSLNVVSSYYQSSYKPYLLNNNSLDEKK